jgi:hypothetical protein
MNIFEPELIAVMKAALTQAAAELRASPSTQAFMAERILQTAATGVSSPEELKSVAMEAGAPGAKRSVRERFDARHDLFHRLILLNPWD